MTRRALQTDGCVDRSAQRVIEHLLDDGIIRSCWHAEQLGSTNSFALEELTGQRIRRWQCPRLILADHQTAGRGRHGRSWLSADQTLTFSLVVHRPADPDSARLLPLAVGVGIAQAIEFDFAPLRTRLKWPNDIYAGHGKVAGILLETSLAAGDFVVIGVGLNVGAPPQLPGSPSAPPVCSLNEATGRNTARYDCLDSILRHLVESLADVSSSVTRFRPRCMLSGSVVRCWHNGQELEGQCRGVDDSGALIVETSDDIRYLRSGEVHTVRKQEQR